MLDKLIKISSISSAFLIFCGVLKLIIYYLEFNIDIIEFLHFQEIITSFLDDINILLIFFIIMLIVTFTITSVATKKHKIQVEDFYEEMLINSYPYKYKSAMFFACIICLLFILIYFNFTGYNYFVIYIIVFSTIQFFSFLIMNKNESNEVYFPNFHFGVSIMLTILTATYLLAKHDIEKTINSCNNVKIFTSNSIIECNKKTKNIYLGKTDSYVFIKVNNSNTSTVIPNSQITKFEFE